MNEYILEPIVPCSNCGVRYAKDFTRDGMGRRLAEEELQEMDLPSPLCDSCQRQRFGEALEADIHYVVEHGLGLTAENKKTLEALMSIIDNPDRVMMVARVQERVDELERRLEDRSNSLTDLVESKMENANSRLFVASLITNAALFLAGLLFGIVVALVLGG